MLKVGNTYDIDSAKELVIGDAIQFDSVNAIEPLVWDININNCGRVRGLLKDYGAESFTLIKRTFPQLRPLK